MTSAGNNTNNRQKPKKKADKVCGSFRLSIPRLHSFFCVVSSFSSQTSPSPSRFVMVQTNRQTNKQTNKQINKQKMPSRLHLPSLAQPDFTVTCYFLTRLLLPLGKGGKGQGRGRQGAAEGEKGKRKGKEARDSSSAAGEREGGEKEGTETHCRAQAEAAAAAAKGRGAEVWWGKSQEGGFQV